jgi:hypothetical protein
MVTGDSNVTYLYRCISVPNHDQYHRSIPLIRTIYSGTYNCGGRRLGDCFHYVHTKGIIIRGEYIIYLIRGLNIKIPETKSCWKTPSLIKTQTKGISIRLIRRQQHNHGTGDGQCKRIHQLQITYSCTWKSLCWRLSVIRLKCILGMRFKKTKTAAFFINLCVFCVLAHASFVGTQFLHTPHPQSITL